MLFKFRLVQFKYKFFKYIIYNLKYIKKCLGRLVNIKESEMIVVKEKFTNFCLKNNQVNIKDKKPFIKLEQF